MKTRKNILRTFVGVGVIAVVGMLLMFLARSLANGGFIGFIVGAVVLLFGSIGLGYLKDSLSGGNFKGIKNGSKKDE